MACTCVLRRPGHVSLRCGWQAAARCLEAVGALDARTARLTEVGRAMARLPLPPRHARMLLQDSATPTPLPLSTTA